MKCNCYVQDLIPEEQFGIRKGGHDPDCPIYRKSQDPVDQIYDLLTQAELKKGT